MAVAVERIRARGRRGQAHLRPRRLRRRRHLRDRARRPLPSRARRRRRLAPAEPVRGGLRRLARDARAARGRGLRARPDGRLRDHGRRGGRRGDARAASRSSSPTTTARRGAARLPDRRDAAVELSVPRALRHGRRLQARRGAARRGPPGRRRNLDLVALATVADVVPLVDENRGARRGGAARARRDPTTGPAGAHAEPRASIRPRVDAGAVGFRLAPRINAAGRLGRPDVALELVLTEDADEARRHADDARGAEPRAPGGRGPDPARGGRAGRGDGPSRGGAGAATCSGARTGTRA